MFINYEDMDFGTEQDPRCGICGRHEENAYYHKHILQEDTICDYCGLFWVYQNEEEEQYVPRLNSKGITDERVIEECKGIMRRREKMLKKSEQKKSKFCRMFWDYTDVRFNAGNVKREKAEEFLESIEQRLFSYLAEAGMFFIKDAWYDKYPDWEEDEDEVQQ